MTDPASNEESALPTVSAVIPAYNAADTIERALNSVYAQTYENTIEVIVVDDGSTDNTVEVIRNKFPDVTLIEQENQGNAGARNTGVAAATGEYIAFLDADDEWLPEKTAVQVSMVQRHPGIALLTAAAMVAGRTPPPSRAPREASQTPRLALFTFRDYLRRVLPEAVQFCCSGWLIQTTVIQHHGFDAGLRRAVDWECLLRLTGQGYAVGAVLEPLYRYHMLSDSVSNSAAGRRAICDIDVEIVSRYDPEGDGWQSELLTQGQFQSALYATYSARAWGLWELGDHEIARESFRRAAELSDARGLRALRERFLAWNPGLYRALSRLRR